MSRFDSNDYALAGSDDETGSQSSKYSSKDSIDGKPTKTRDLKKRRELRPIYFVVSCLVIVMAGSVSVALFFIIETALMPNNLVLLSCSLFSLGVESLFICCYVFDASKGFSYFGVSCFTFCVFTFVYV